MKAWKFLGAPLMLMLLSGMPWSDAFAADDTTEPVIVDSQSGVTVGNVTVEGQGRAVSVTGTEDEASVTVEGNVTLTNEPEFEPSENDRYITGVYAENHGSNATATINGNVSTEGGAYANGVMALDFSNDGSATINVNGNVSSVSGNQVYGVYADRATVNVAGDVAAKGRLTEGLHVITGNNKTINVNVGGSLSAKGYTDAAGASLMRWDGDTGSISVTVGNGITSESETEDTYSNGAVGISLLNTATNSNYSLDVKGDVVAKNSSGLAKAINSNGAFYRELDPSDTTGTSTVSVHGNLISDGTGLYRKVFGEGYDDELNVLVDGTIDAKKVGVMIANEVSDEDNENVDPKLNLTVWKVIPNGNENVAEFAPDPIEEMYGTATPKPATNFEKKIMYIIKVEQPSAGGTIQAVDANGNPLAKSFDFDVAHEGDMVVLKATLEDGYKLVGAYNGEGEKALLEKDENGNYYIIIPKGGGVYLTVEVEYDAEHSYSNPDDNEETITGDNLEKEEAPIEIEKEEIKADEPANTDSVSTSKKSESNSNAVKTGDEKQVAPWLILSVVGIGGIAGLDMLSKNRVKKAEEK